jgi:hypothetical protein
MKTLIACLVAVAPVVCLAQPPSRPVQRPTSREEIASLLEKRWPLEAIIDYCTPERRWDTRDQNLVPDEEGIWQGTLHEGQAQPFDKISWYARVSDKELTYFLNAKRDKDLWWLEIGDEGNLHHPLSDIRETITADFLKSRGFVERMPSMWALPPMSLEKAAKLVGFRLDEIRPTQERGVSPPKASPGSFHSLCVRTRYQQEFRIKCPNPQLGQNATVTVIYYFDKATMNDLIIRSLFRRNYFNAQLRESKSNRPSCF